MHWTSRVGRRLSPRDLHVFMAVAEAGSMAKAADRLAVSRPVVSKSVAALERTLGVPLFDRAASGVEPTRYGEALLRSGLAVFDSLRQGVEQIAGLADPGSGLLRIGSTELNSSSLVAEAIARLLRRHPRMTFDVQQGTARSRAQLLRDREVDLFVTRLVDPFIDPEFELRRLYGERMRIVCGSRAPWARRRRVTLADLTGASWILSKNEAGPGRPVHDAFVAAGLVPPTPCVLSDSLGQRYRLLELGPFVTLMSETALALGPQSTGIHVLPVELLSAPTEVAVATLRNRTVTPAAALFVAELEAVAATRDAA